MNTTTTETITQASSAAAECRKAGPNKRRMARAPSGTAAAKMAGAPDQSHTGETSTRATTKIASVIALLESEQGATLAEMVKATGWLPHITRAALTGLKKKGHALSKGKRDDMTCYRIVKAA